MRYQTEIERRDATESRRAEMEELCIATKSKLLSLLGTNRIREPPSLLDSTINSSVQKSSRLPCLKLPQFDGKYFEYKNFISTFKSLVHDEINLTDIEKFNHLLSCLSGDALRTVKAFQITAENYTKALKLLSERYDKKCLIFFDCIEQIFKIPNMNKPDAVSLRNAVDSVSAIFQSLLSLGTHEDITNALIIHLVLSKVDKATNIKWNEQLDYANLPTWEECSKLLIRCCQNLEVNSERANSFDNRSNRNTQIHKHKSSFVGSSKNSSLIKCVYCQSKDHKIYTCTKYSAISVAERFNFAKKSGLCLNCLQKGHGVSTCRSSHCRVCVKPHHTLLHKFEVGYTSVGTEGLSNSNVAQPNQVNSTKSTMCAQSSKNVVILATALVHVKDKYGNYHTARALLDSGSQINFMTQQFVNKLMLKGEQTRMQISGIGDVNTSVSHKVSAVAKSRINAYTFSTDFYILDSISTSQPEAELFTNSWNIPGNIVLADPYFFQKRKIDMLIGADVFFDLLCVGQIKLNDSLPSLQKTLLGWVVSGKCKIENAVSHICNLVQNGIEEEPLEAFVRKFWEYEEVMSTVSKTSQEQKECESHFIENYEILSSGRFQVRLPFKQSPASLGASFETARRRFLALERRLSKTPDVKTMYSNFMKEYRDLGHMSATDNCIPATPHYFIPHQCVMRPQSTSTKLRVVFDASCKTSTQISLNNVLMVGPTVQPELFITLLKFRCFKYGLTADVTKMYRQILVHESDRKYQLIVWRENEDMPLQIYKLNTVTYGTATAPFLATRCLQELSELNKHKFPNGSKVLSEDFYVDDMLTGADSVHTLAIKRSETIKILESAGLTLAKWHSNHPDYNNLSDKTIKLNEEDITRTLGLIWCPVKDEFKFTWSDDFSCITATKRNILSISSRLFDPLGIVGPIIVKAKLILRELWSLKLDWDESIPLELETIWQSFNNDLKLISNIKIPRFVHTSIGSDIEIHGFADASSKAYGCCIYTRAFVGNQHIVKLLTAKSKISPTKTKSIPRLELCAAHLLTKLFKKIESIVKPYCKSVTFWSDSEVVLFWLTTCPSTKKTYVANRLAEVQEFSNCAEWRYVPTAENPADIISRGCSVNELMSSNWFEGPTFLKFDKSVWPDNKKFKLSDDDPCVETKKTKVSLVAVNSHKSIIDEVIERCSSYTKIVNIVAYIYRWLSKNNSKTCLESKPKNYLSAKEVQWAFYKIVEHIQSRDYRDEIKSIQKEVPLKSHIQKLAPFLKEYIDGSKKCMLLRVGGRLLNAHNISDETKHPLLLPKTCKFAQLYLKHLHISNCHAGAKILTNLLRRKIWVINARQLARKIVKNCILCYKYKPTLVTQIMGDLPADRLNCIRPFQITGVDFCGPFYTSLRIRGRPPYKSYAAVFVCFASKAVHIEACTDLSTNSFIAVLKRFIARRNVPDKIYCDNATNFVGASARLSEVKQHFFGEQQIAKLMHFAAEKQIEFIFIPPRAPHFGGLWEAAVKSMKTLVNKVLGNALLTYDELETILIEAEAILNSRPISQLTEDPNDDVAITPTHLLTGSMPNTIPEVRATGGMIPYNKRFELITTLKSHLWSTFQKDYFSELQTRSKWTIPQRSLQEGDLVLIYEENIPPQQWMMGRIVNAIAGSDKRVRVADIKTKSGLIRRAVHRLALIPTITS